MEIESKLYSIESIGQPGLPHDEVQSPIRLNSYLESFSVPTNFFFFDSLMFCTHIQLLNTTCNSIMLMFSYFSGVNYNILLVAWHLTQARSGYRQET